MRLFTTILALALALVTVGLYRVINYDRVLWRQAEDAGRHGDYRQALGTYALLWSEGFRPALVFPRLFVSYLQVGQPEKAAQVARQAVLLAQSSPPARIADESGSIPEWKARLELARALSYTKQYPESIAEYRRVLKMKESLSQAQLELARVLFWAGRGDEALVEFKRVPPSALQRDDRVAIADLSAAASLYEKAESEYRSLLAGDPDDFAVREKLADLLSWRVKYDESLREYEKILGKFPDNVRVRRKYANVLMWSGQNQKAIDELKKTLPENAAGKQ
jgi:tetratricopeptide (TPR) repeat protein